MQMILHFIPVKKYDKSQWLVENENNFFRYDKLRLLAWMDSRSVARQAEPIGIVVCPSAKFAPLTGPLKNLIYPPTKAFLLHLWMDYND